LDQVTLLPAELDEADSFNDAARAANARQEMDFLVGGLARRSGWAAATAGLTPRDPSAPA